MARPGGTSPTVRRCSTPWRRTVSTASNRRCSRRSTPRARGFDAQLHSIAQAYVDFATRHAALLELMFAGKHREGADATHAAAERALAIPLSTIVEAQRAGEVIKVDPERLNQVAFATLHGLATMANGGMMPGHDIDPVVTDAVEQLLHGLRPRPGDEPSAASELMPHCASRSGPGDAGLSEDAR